MPFAGLTWMTYRLIVSLRQFYARREQITRAKLTDNDLTKTLIVVVLVFMVCQVLNPIRRFLVVVLPARAQSCGSFFFYFSSISTPAITVESSVHFFIYSLCNRRFRDKLRSKIGLKGKCCFGSIAPVEPMYNINLSIQPAGSSSGRSNKSMRVQRSQQSTSQTGKSVQPDAGV